MLKPNDDDLIGPALSVLLTFLVGIVLSTLPSRSTAEHNDFRQHVAPFLQNHCLKCHGPKKPEGDLRLDTVDANLLTGKDVDTWQLVFEKLTLGEMPPEDETQPSESSKEQILSWIKAELHRAGKPVDEQKFANPKFGNYVNHDTLFNREPTLAAASPARLWRLGPHVYSSLVYRLTKNGVKTAQPFAASASEGFKDYAALYIIDEPTTGQLIRNARSVVQLQTQYKFGDDGKIRAASYQARKEFMPLVDPKTPPNDEQIEKAIRHQFDLVLQRQPSEEELERFINLMNKNMREAGQVIGAQATLMAVLLMPEAVYRMEMGDGPVDHHGRQMLAPRELAYAISYALTDERPASALLRAVDEDRLATREEVAAQVERILNDSKLKKPRILRFFQEYFGYVDAVAVFKEKQEFEHHDARVLVEDTNHLIANILEQDKNVFYELLTTDKSFVNYRWDNNKKRPRIAHEKRRVQLSYGLPENWKWTTQQPVRLPGDQRTGILSQPSWLVAHSQNLENHPIIRGKWVRERLLGGTVPDLPITVDAQLPEDPEKTLGERLQVTRQEYCWQCHRRMNPLGLPFEMYDHFGRFRTTELEKPVNAHGHIDDSGDKKLDSKVTNAVEMIHRLAKSDRVQQVFIRHAFRYFMGRNETIRDAKTLQDANRDYNESGGSMKALIVSLLTSDSFLYRVK